MKHFLLTLLLASHGLMAHAAGTIGFANGISSKVSWSGSRYSPYVPTNSGLVHYGVFWGTNRDNLSLVLPLGSNSTQAAGNIVGPGRDRGIAYQIPGTEPGQIVYLQIRGWRAEYGTNWYEARKAEYDETDIRQVILGPEAGPGPVIWQNAGGSNPNQFWPLSLTAALTPPAVINMSDITVDEGNQGTVDAIFTLTRGAFYPYSTSIDYSSFVWLSTSNMTALAGQDYVPTNVVVSFAPMQTTTQVRITLTSDILSEPDKQFGINLSFPAVAYTLRSSAVVTIREARVVSVRRNVANAVVTIRTTSTQRYALESSPDMVSWSVVPGAENIAGTGGNVPITDSSQPCCDPRFYRMQILP